MRGLLVSVVIPVYNVEAYLDRCMNSVVGQSYGELQIILVDDGSRDRSGKLCDEWAARDARIQVIHKQNEGAGPARTRGMQEARGEYLMFMDSDDRIDGRTVERLLDKAVAESADACYCGFVDVDLSGNARKGIPPKKLSYEGKEIREFVGYAIGGPPQMTQNCFCGYSACACLYKMSVIRDGAVTFRNERNIYSEDLLFNVAFCKKAGKVVILPECLYYYYAMPKSSGGRPFEAVLNMHRVLCQSIREKWGRDAFLLQRIERRYMDNLITYIRQEVALAGKDGCQGCPERIRQVCRQETTQAVLSRYPIANMQIRQRILFSLILHRRERLVYLLFKLRYRSG